MHTLTLFLSIRRKKNKKEKIKHFSSPRLLAKCAPIRHCQVGSKLMENANKDEGPHVPLGHTSLARS